MIFLNKYLIKNNNDSRSGGSRRDLKAGPEPYKSRDNSRTVSTFTAQLVTEAVTNRRMSLLKWPQGTFVKK